MKTDKTMKTKIATPTPKTAVEASATTPARKRNAKTTPTEVKVTAAEAPVAPTVKAPATSQPTTTIASRVENRQVDAPKAAPQATRRREITSDLIAARAYTIWEQQGRPQGRERDNWLLAESQLKQEIQSFTA